MSGGEFVDQYASPSLLNFSLDLPLISRVPYVLIDRKRDLPNERRGVAGSMRAHNDGAVSGADNGACAKPLSLTRRRYTNKQRGVGSGGKTLLELPILHVTIEDNAAEAATTRPHNDNGSRGNLQFHSLLTMEINRFWAKTLCFATGRPSF